jgi:nucleoid-associated protein YgaU
MGSKGVALVVAVIGVIALAAAGIYLYRHHGAAPPVEDKVATGETPAGEPAKPAESKPVDAKPTAVPSFDVVRIEPTGDGVIAGRGEPGWTIALEDSGSKIAETKIDEEGAWSIVLDTPLSAGDHSLTLRAMSPDGTKGVTGQQPVKVAVGKPGEAVVAQTEPSAEEKQPAEAAAPEQQAAAPQAEPQAVPGQPEPVVPEEGAAPPERPKPPVKIGKLDYQDTGSGSGKILMSGVGDPNVRVVFFFDEQPLGETVIGSDGTWVFEVEKTLEEGEHVIRADIYDGNSGMVAGRASIRLAREATPQAAPAAAAEASAPSGQPQPVYPDGPPTDAGTASQPPVTATAAAEPQDLSRQPQPVYPDGAAEAEKPSAEPAPEVAEVPTGTRPQPQPVYPDGPPADLDTPSTYAEVKPQPQDLSSQPQPVYPQEEATTETAAAEPAPAEPAPAEPAPAAPSQAVTAETPSEAKPAEEPKKAPVVFGSVDYRDTGSDSGKVALSGTSEPGARIFLYIDDTPLGEVSAGSDGTWSFEADRKLVTGDHNIRADGIDEATRAVVSSTSIGITRMEPPKEEVAAAPAEPAPTPPEQASPPAAEAAPEPAAPSEPEQEVAKAHEVTEPDREELPQVYTVRRGDTLWDIAESYYGGGWRYRAIVRDNRRKIRNPHWIYPEQKFDMRVDK